MSTKTAVAQLMFNTTVDLIQKRYPDMPFSDAFDKMVAEDKTCKESLEKMQEVIDEMPIEEKRSFMIDLEKHLNKILSKDNIEQNRAQKKQEQENKKNDRTKKEQKDKISKKDLTRVIKGLYMDSFRHGNIVFNTAETAYQFAKFAKEVGHDPIDSTKMFIRSCIFEMQMGNPHVLPKPVADFQRALVGPDSFFHKSIDKLVNTFGLEEMIDREIGASSSQLSNEEKGVTLLEQSGLKDEDVGKAIAQKLTHSTASDDIKNILITDLVHQVTNDPQYGCQNMAKFFKSHFNACWSNSGDAWKQAMLEYEHMKNDLNKENEGPSVSQTKGVSLKDPYPQEKINKRPREEEELSIG